MENIGDLHIKGGTLLKDGQPAKFADEIISGIHITETLNSPRTRFWFDAFLGGGMKLYRSYTGTATTKVDFAYDKSPVGGIFRAIDESGSHVSSDESKMGEAVKLEKGKYALSLTGQRYQVGHIQEMQSAETLLNVGRGGFTMVAIIKPTNYGESDQYVNSRQLLGCDKYGIGIGRQGFLLGGDVEGSLAHASVDFDIGKTYIVVATYRSEGVWKLQVYGEDSYAENTTASNPLDMQSSYSDVVMGGGFYRYNVLESSAMLPVEQRTFLGSIYEILSTGLDLEDAEIKKSLIHHFADKWGIPNIKTE